MVEIMIAIAIIITLSYLATPLIQKQRMLDDVRGAVNEVANIINSDIRDPYYGYIQENTNTLNSIISNNMCKTSSTIPACSGNLTYRCISANRVAYCSGKSKLKNSITNSSFNLSSNVGNGYKPDYNLKLMSIPNTIYMNLKQNNNNSFKIKIIVRGTYYTPDEKNLILVMLKSKLFSDIGIFNSLVENQTIDTLCDETHNTCEIEYILR